MKNGKKMLCFALILGLLLPCLSGCAAAQMEDRAKVEDPPTQRI